MWVVNSFYRASKHEDRPPVAYSNIVPPWSGFPIDFDAGSHTEMLGKAAQSLWVAYLQTELSTYLHTDTKELLFYTYAPLPERDGGEAGVPPFFGGKYLDDLQGSPPQLADVRDVRAPGGECPL